MAEVDLDVLNKFLNPDLGIVSLIPGLTLGNTEPTTLPTIPSVMVDFELVASTAYRWQYNQIRYLKLGYVLQRDGEFETGELDIISKAVKVSSINPETYVIPDIFVEQTITQQTGGALGVDITAMTDSLSTLQEPRFGIAYKITNATPTIFPTIRVFVLKLLPLGG